jgi:hypothetical protein
VLISQISPGTVRVRGNVGADGIATKVNGAAYTDFKVTGGLNITFGGGNDSVYFSPIAPPSFHDVNLNLAGPTTTSTRTLTSTTSFSLLTPPDKDYVSMNEVTIPGWLTINTGIDDDQVYIRDTNVGHSDLKSGAPNTGGITVNTGLGNDIINFDGLRSSHDIIIDAGAGHDRVDVLNGALIDNFMAELGDGDDVMTVNAMNTRLRPNSAKTQISGAGGSDRLTTIGFPAKNLELTGWEYINGTPVFAPVANPVSGGVATKV